MAARQSRGVVAGPRLLGLSGGLCLATRFLRVAGCLLVLRPIGCGPLCRVALGGLLRLGTLGGFLCRARSRVAA